MQGEVGAPGADGPQGTPGDTGLTGDQGLQGVQGEVGAPGADGPQGTPGDTGLTGDQGLQGAQGETGDQGLQGVQGDLGATGDTGPAGPQGVAGADGSAGPAGADGAQGPAGDPGPPGSNEPAEYAYVYNLGAQTVPLEASVAFDMGGVLSPGFTHAPGSAGIGIVNSGIYMLTFSVSGTEPNQMALFVNGTVVPGTIYASGAGTQQNTGQGIAAIAAGDVLTLKNHTSSAAVGLAAPIGGTQASTNASVTVEKLD